MKYIDEYRDPALVAGLLKKISKVSDALAHNVTIMESAAVTHTQSDTSEFENFCRQHQINFRAGLSGLCNIFA